jgi:hypothetical protein
MTQSAFVSAITIQSARARCVYCRSSDQIYRPFPKVLSQPTPAVTHVDQVAEQLPIDDTPRKTRPPILSPQITSIQSP